MGKCHCPKYGDIKFLPCGDPPSAEILRDEVVRIIEENGAYASQEQEQQWRRLAKFMRKNIPERQWSLGMLAVVAPQHDVFQKGYKPPPKRLAQQLFQQPMIPNHNGFMDNLPELSAKELKKGGGVSFLTKRQRLEMQLERLEEKKNRLELAKQKKQADLMLMEDENSNEEFFKYKISAKDYDILQQAKAQGA